MPNFLRPVPTLLVGVAIGYLVLPKVIAKVS